MSTEMQVRKTGEYYITRFWGGNSRGTCIQVTAPGYPYRYTAFSKVECQSLSDNELLNSLNDIGLQNVSVLLSATADVRDFGHNRLKERG